MPAQFTSQLCEMVFRELLIANEPLSPPRPAQVTQAWQVLFSQPRRLQPGVVIALALSNREISVGAMAYFCHNNTFRLNVSSPIDRGFLNRTRRVNSDSIHRLIVMVEGNPLTLGQKLLGMQNTISKRCRRGLRDIQYELGLPLDIALATHEKFTVPGMSRSWRRRLKGLERMNNQGHGSRSRVVGPPYLGGSEAPSRG